MWSALDSFSKYQAYFWPQPFEWDYCRQQFVAHAKSTRFLPHFVSMVAIGSAPLACVTLLTAQSLGLCNLDLLEELVTILLLLLVTLTLVAEWSFSRQGNDFKFFINSLKRLDAQIQSSKFKCEVILRYFWFGCVIFEVCDKSEFSKFVLHFVLCQVCTFCRIKLIEWVFSDGLYLWSTYAVPG